MSVKETPHASPLFFYGQYQNGLEYQPKSDEKHMPLLYLKFWTYTHLIKTCKTEARNILLFVVCISFYYISADNHFSQIFRTSLNIISKKDFCHNFSFLVMHSPWPPITNYVEFPGMKLCFVWNFWGWSKIKSRNSRDEEWDFFWNSPLMDYPDNQRKSLIIPQDNWLSIAQMKCRRWFGKLSFFDNT